MNFKQFKVKSNLLEYLEYHRTPILLSLNTQYFTHWTPNNPLTEHPILHSLNTQYFTYWTPNNPLTEHPILHLLDTQ